MSFNHQTSKMHKIIKKVFSSVFVLCMALTTILTGVKKVNAREPQLAELATTDWKIDEQTNRIGAVLEEIVEADSKKIHIASSSNNGNNPKDQNGYPLIAVNKHTFDLSQEGTIRFDLTANTEVDDIRFGVYLGYNGPGNGMFFGYDAAGWFWQKYQNGDGPYYTGARMQWPKNKATVNVQVSWTASKTASLKVDDETVFENIPFADLEDLQNQIAIKAGTYYGTVTDIKLTNNIHHEDENETNPEDSQSDEKVQVKGKVSADNQALANVKIDIDPCKEGNCAVYTDANGEFELNHLVKGTDYIISATKDGYESDVKHIRADADGEPLEFVLQRKKEITSKILTTPFMDVHVDPSFPRVISYEMKQGSLQGKKFLGQEKEINTVLINEQKIAIKPENVKADFTADKATYVMHAEGRNVNVDITAELIAENDTLAFNITEIKNHLEDSVDGNPVQTIEFPNQSLVSIRSDQTNANLKAAGMSSDTTISGDAYQVLNKQSNVGSDEYMYAFISNSEMSAGLWSNSEHNANRGGVEGGSNNYRVTVNVDHAGTEKTMGLSSSKWYYHRVVQDSHGRKYMVSETEMPKTKVIITGERNDDGVINWQDGAIAFREIMNNPYKCEGVPELVSWRIAMNFGGQAQNPFLTTLDNVKRVALHTDGLGQSVLLKGYASEGHDSGHPDYANIGERIGGEEDMNTLMEKGAEYGAKFGIHVNAGEMYPEAQAFTDDSVRRRNGGLSYGWNWLDQAVGLDSVYDLATGNRKARFAALKEKVGNNLDFVYVDIWGNQTGGDDDSWQTRKLSKEINDNGWKMANEWGAANEYDATFQHWATDLTYGGYSMKGENSEVMRFLRNHQKDSWVGDYPNYGGAAYAPLLGGYNMKDFEGWQGRNDYDTYITNIYTHDLMTKFLQHFKVVKWVDSETPVTHTIYWSGYDYYTGKYVPKSKTYQWYPEMEITLKDDNGNVVVVKRGSNDINDPAYRDRTVTYNGVEISHGAVSRGDRSNQDIQQGVNRGTEAYLLPWNWDAKNGKRLSANEEKLYHWNTQGGTTTWTLPDTWQDTSVVTVYKLTDQGKAEPKEITVSNGTVTLEADAETPYVLYKTAHENINVLWSEGMHIIDAGFNSGNLDAWTLAGEGSAELVKSQYSNPMLKLAEGKSASQVLTDLVPGKKYAALVGVDNRSDSKASITIHHNGEVLATNYTNKSIALNYVKAYTHNTHSATVDGTSYFQNMYVYFTAPEDGTVTLTLSKEAGEGSAYFDDIRIVQNNAENAKYDDKGQLTEFKQDFEENVQGIYPFVIGGIEGVEDNRTHLSERHDKYTQAGWDVKRMDDVLEGKWSLKTNGLVSRSDLVYQTIPQNLRLEPGRTYKVSFDYQMGSEGIYAFIQGDGEYGSGTKLLDLEKGLGTTRHFETTIVGALDGQSWFGIYSTNQWPQYDKAGISGNEQNFGGYKDFILDNLVVERVDQNISKEMMQQLIEEATHGIENHLYKDSAVDKIEKRIDEAKVALEKDHFNQSDLADAYYALYAAIHDDSLKNIAPENDDSADIPLEKWDISAGSYEEDAYDEGNPLFAVDGRTDTRWHTAYAPDPMDKHTIRATFHEPQTVTGIRFLQRGGRTNGVIQEGEVWIKEKDQPERKVATKTFEQEGWQIVQFDQPIENVEYVEFRSLKTLGRLSRDNNKYSAMAEFRALGLKSTPNKPLPDKSELSQLLEEANAMDRDAYTEESFAELDKKIEAAKQVLASENPSNYDILLAMTNLRDEMKNMKKMHVSIQRINKVPKGYEGYTLETYDIHFEDEDGKDVQITKPREIHVNLADIESDQIKILHEKHNGEWEEIPVKSIAGKEVVFVNDDFSAYSFIDMHSKPNENVPPIVKPGDNNTPKTPSGSQTNQKNNQSEKSVATRDYNNIIWYGVGLVSMLLLASISYFLKKKHQ